MKKNLLWGILLCTAVSYGQTIDFPDPVFKSWLLSTSTDSWRALDANGYNMAIDANNDGEIDETEALAVYELRFSYSGSAGGQITSVAGVEHFTNLRVLEVGSHNLTELDATALTLLERLDISRNEVTMANLHIDGLANLEDLHIAVNPLGSLTPTGLTSLKILRATAAQLITLDLSGFPNLEYLQGDRNYLTALDASVTPMLKGLTCNNNQISSLNLIGLALDYLECSNNPLPDLDVSNMTSLTVLQCDNTGINSIDVTALTGLIRLDVSGNPITSLDVSTLTSLEQISCNNTLITELDLSAIPNPGLWFLAANNPLLVSINVHNGVIVEYPYECWMVNNPNLEFICVDEGEEEAFLEYFEYNDMVPPYMSSECNYEPGQAYNLISGKLTYDIDLNGCEAEDFALSNIPVVISDGVTETTRFTNNYGEYQAYKGPGTYTITPTMENTPYIADPLSNTAVFTAFDGSEQTHDFCITNSELVTDAYIYLYPLNNANPGFQNGYKLILKNKGTQ